MEEKKDERIEELDDKQLEDTSGGWLVPDRTDRSNEFFYYCTKCGKAFPCSYLQKFKITECPICYPTST